MSYTRCALLALAAATLTLACHPGVEGPGVPLYPNGETSRLPPNQIAQVAGPIATIDGKDVVDQGRLFDLLPGCHVIELDRRVAGDTNLSGGTYFSGEFPVTIYAVHMKAGARYVIRREIYSEGQGGRIVLSAREEQPNGVATDLNPAKSDEEIKACKEGAP